MNHKQMPRLGSAIASTILSVFWAVSLVGVDKAQAAVLHYNFDVDDYFGSGFFKVDNSSLTGIEYEEIAVSEGTFYTDFTLPYKKHPKEYYDLAGATASFYQGDFSGLQASGRDELTAEDNIIEDEGVTYYTNYVGQLSWNINTNGGRSWFNGVSEVILSSDGVVRQFYFDVPVSYTLINTETVPEPLTAGGTALALAGLSWLKHKKKKKMAA
jgi:hypothetical protein